MLTLKSSLLVALSVLVTAVAADSSIDVDIGYATYRGSYSSDLDISSFKGIRYAAAPTGNNRFRAPQAPQQMSGVQDGTQVGDACFQSGGGVNPTNPLTKVVQQNTSDPSSKRELLEKRDNFFGAEDCLFLNVFTPGQASSSKNYPVLIFIHGGGYTSGQVQAPLASDFVLESGNKLVAVQMQYRLGMWGFLSSADVKANGNPNAGLLDQRFAMQWVQSHIEKFGGDPSRVTIWGESAGAGSVIQHVVAEKGQTNPPLFRAAMSSSAYLPVQYQYNDVVPEYTYQQTANIAGCGSASDKLACMRAASSDTMQKANNAISFATLNFGVPYGPVIDGSFIQENPLTTLASYKHNGEVVLTVNNPFEGETFVPNNNSLSFTYWVGQLYPELSAQQISTLDKAYQIVGPNDYHRTIAARGERELICPSYWLMNAFGSGKSYRSQFWIEPGVHAQDTLYYFPMVQNSTALANMKNNAFVMTFAGSFMSFAVNLNPNDKTTSENQTPNWQPWIYQEQQAEMLFAKRPDGSNWFEQGKSDQDLLDRCEIWHSFAMQRINKSP